MGSNKAHRFKNEKECTDYLTSIGVTNLTCKKYGGTFKSRSIFQCNKDNYEWESTLDAVSRARSTGCPMCGRVAKIKGVEDVNSWLKHNNRSIECLYYDGKAASSNSRFKCLIDGYEWNGKVSNIKSGKGCPVCAKVKKITEIDEVNQWLKDNNKSFSCIDYCGNVRELSIFKCGICNKEWKSSFNNIKNGNCCPHCSSSKGEKEIEKLLDKHNIDYRTQYWFQDCRIQLPLPFDFAVFSNEKLICLFEYQGIQHYEPVDFAGKGFNWAKKQFKRNQKSDDIKRTYCKDNNIPLLEIPYWEYKNMETIILDFMQEVA